MSARPAAAGRRSGRRAAPAQAGRDARARPRGAAHRQDPAVGAGGAAAHPDRGRDHRPRRLQRPHPAQGRASRCSRPSTSSTWPRPRSRRPPSTTSPRWNGSAPRRTSAWSVRPAPARSTCSSRSATPPSHAGHRVRYFTAADLVETLYRGLADNTVGRVIDTLLRNDLIIVDEVGFAPLDDTGAQLLFRFVAAAYERRALASPALALRPGAGSCPSTPPPSACSTGSCTTPPSWSPTASPTACAKPEPDDRRCHPDQLNQPEGWGLSLGHQRGPQLGH